MISPVVIRPFFCDTGEHMEKTVRQRLAEFVDYHIHGDGEANGVILRELADRRRMTRQERYELAYFYSVTYCIMSALTMMNEKAEIFRDPAGYADAHLKTLIFQSDRRYTRVNGNFGKMLRQFVSDLSDEKSFREKTSAGEAVSLQKALNEVRQWYFFGRFGAFLFIETYCRITGDELRGGQTIDWSEGDTATSGLMNVFGLDRSADYFDKHDKLPERITKEKLDMMLNKVTSEISKAGGSTNLTEVETSLCAYRKFYKGTRYNGYYLDRILEELIWFEKAQGRSRDLDDIYRIRADRFDPRYLGEAHGWKGVRPECKTLYKQTGQVM